MIRGFSFQRGLSLLATMAFATSMMLFAAVIIALPVTFGQMERLRSNSQEAERMAWSITQLAQAELEANPEWGKDGTAELVLEGPGWPGKATLSFSTGDPNLRSVYNMSIDSNTIKGSLDNYVPSRSIHLIGTATVGQATRSYEVIIQKRGMEYAVASSGPFRMTGSNEAAALDSLDEFRGIDTTGGVRRDDVIKDDQKKTSIATSYSPSAGSPGPSMTFEDQLVLYGDAVASGSISGTENIQFKNGGQSKPGSNVELPKIQISDYDPTGPNSQVDQQWVKRPNSASYQDLPISGFNRWEGGGSELLLNGNTTLENGLLYVPGDLRINGSISGKGAIIVEGDLIITGHADLSASSQVAVLSQGDLTFHGTTKSQSLFTGLLYSEGKLDIANVTTVGGIIANNPTDPEKASVTVQDVTLVNQQEAVEFDLKFEVGQPEFPSVPGQVTLDLAAQRLEIIEPDINDFIDPRTGAYNGNPLVFKVKHTSVNGTITTYDSAAEASANLGLGAQQALGFAEGWADANWQTVLDNLSSNDHQQVPLFQLDPNTLLSEAARVKVFFSRYHNG